MSLFATLTTIVCLALTAAIDPGMIFIASSPLHNGSYSGCTKKIIDNRQNNSISTLCNILELTTIATLFVVYTSPVLVVLPMGGGDTKTKQLQYHNTSASNKQKLGKGTKKRIWSTSNNDEHDESPDNKKPRNVGRPQTFKNHICNSCTIWIQSGAHPSLQAHHLCTKMRHPGAKFQLFPIISLNPYFYFPLSFVYSAFLPYTNHYMF